MSTAEQAIKDVRAAKNRAELQAVAAKHQALADTNPDVFDAVEQAFQNIDLTGSEGPAQGELPSRPAQRQQSKRPQHNGPSQTSKPLPVVTPEEVVAPPVRLRRPEGIAGLVGKEPVGAVLTIGHKGPRGNPIDKDRFFIVEPFANKDDIRPLHPAFAAFNAAPIEKRRAISGFLVHGTQAECFEHHLKAQKFPKPYPNHKDRHPTCVGDGVTATRWTGETFQQIKCPHDLCEYRQKENGQKPACTPFGRLLFRPKWPEGNPLPAPLIKLTTNAWSSTSSMKGFFDYVAKQAGLLGAHDFSLYGMPFTLTLSEKTKPSEQRVFPTLSMSPDGDLQRFLMNNMQRRAELAAARPVIAITDGSEQDPRVIEADYVTIVPGAGIPAESAAP